MTNFPSALDQTQQVIQAERMWLEAHRRLDISALDGLMGVDYIQINNRGEPLGKQQVLASFQAGQRFWQAAESDEYQIRLYGDVAVVMGRWRAAGVNTGQAFNYAARYIAVWLYRDRRWQLVSDQSTTILSAPGA